MIMKAGFLLFEMLYLSMIIHINFVELDSLKISETEWSNNVHVSLCHIMNASRHEFIPTNSNDAPTDRYTLLTHAYYQDSVLLPFIFIVNFQS